MSHTLPCVYPFVWHRGKRTIKTAMFLVLHSCFPRPFDKRQSHPGITIGQFFQHLRDVIGGIRPRGLGRIQWVACIFVYVFWVLYRKMAKERKDKKIGVGLGKGWLTAGAFHVWCHSWCLTAGTSAQRNLRDDTSLLLSISQCPRAGNKPHWQNIVFPAPQRSYIQCIYVSYIHCILYIVFIHFIYVSYIHIQSTLPTMSPVGTERKWHSKESGIAGRFLCIDLLCLAQRVMGGLGWIPIRILPNEHPSRNQL